MSSIKFKVESDTGRKVRVTLSRRDPRGPFWYRFKIKGKGVCRSSKRMDERGARAVASAAALNALEERRDTGAPLLLPNAVQLYLDARWPVDVRTNHLTYSDHKLRLNGFQKSAPFLDVSTATGEQMRATVQAYLSARAAKGLAARTMVRDQEVLSRFCVWLRKSGRVAWRENPAARAMLDMEKPDDVSLPPLPEESIPEFIARARQSEVWPVVLLCLGCGLRPREACRVEWEHIDDAGGVLKVFGKKRWRTLRIGAWALKELRAMTRGVGLLFPFNASTAFDMVARLRAIAPPLPAACTLQACRRTAARRAAQSMSPIDYANYFGHSLQVAHRHYLGFGIVSTAAALDTLSY